jgi:hypothetical protein
MTVTLNLPPDVERAFLGEAQVRGVSSDECIRELLMARAAKLPNDGASEHDHYLYSHPKRNQ